MARAHRLELQLDDAELDELDEQRGNMPRAVYLRSLIRRPPETTTVASREESLGILTALARAGKVPAAVALERALRDVGEQPDDGWLDRLVNGGG